jgi:hypothetical protein
MELSSAAIARSGDSLIMNFRDLLEETPMAKTHPLRRLIFKKEKKTPMNDTWNVPVCVDWLIKTQGSILCFISFLYNRFGSHEGKYAEMNAYALLVRFEQRCRPRLAGKQDNSLELINVIQLTCAVARASWILEETRESAIAALRAFVLRRPLVIASFIARRELAALEDAPHGNHASACLVRTLRGLDKSELGLHGFDAMVGAQSLEKFYTMSGKTTPGSEKDQMLILAIGSCWKAIDIEQDPDSQFRLGSHLLKRTISPNPEALSVVELGLIQPWTDGVSISSASISASTDFYHKAAQQMHPIAMHNFATCLAVGSGVAKNLETAVMYYAIAAPHFSPAMTAYGGCKLFGLGCPQDFDRAFSLIHQAACLHEPYAKLNKKVLEQVDPEKRASEFRWPPLFHSGTVFTPGTWLHTPDGQRSYGLASLLGAKPLAQLRAVDCPSSHTKKDGVFEFGEPGLLRPSFSFFFFVTMFGTPEPLQMSLISLLNFRSFGALDRRRFTLCCIGHETVSGRDFLIDLPTHCTTDFVHAGTHLASFRMPITHALSNAHLNIGVHDKRDLLGHDRISNAPPA